MKVEVTNMPFKNRFAREESGDFDVIIDGWSSDYADPNSFLEMFQKTNVNNYAGTITWGEGNQELGIAVHVDVVPPDEGWTNDPFQMLVKDGRIYGRGSQDNKGPALACYYAMLALKKQGFQPKKKITFIIGTDEETDWVGMKYYLKKFKASDFLFSPDSGFPINNGQSGLAVLTTTFTGAKSTADLQ